MYLVHTYIHTHTLKHVFCIYLQVLDLVGSQSPACPWPPSTWPTTTATREIRGLPGEVSYWLIKKTVQLSCSCFSQLFWHDNLKEVELSTNRLAPRLATIQKKAFTEHQKHEYFFKRTFMCLMTCLGIATKTVFALLIFSIPLSLLALCFFPLFCTDLPEAVN